MATDRSPIAYIWPTLKAFATGDVITRELLRDSINKAGDIGYGVLAALNERFQQLGSTNAGTNAVQRGTVIMGTLSFYDPVDVPVGDLDGKTLILETDLAGPVTVTFSQPTSPVHVATQINVQAASLGLVASVDSGVDPNTGAVVAANVGKLLLVRPSGVSAEMTVKGAGTANAILGLPLVDTTTAGTGTVNDGASRVGLAALGSFVGGSLRSYLATIDSAVSGAVADVATRVAKAGDTMSGGLTAPSLTVNNASNTVTLAARTVTRSIAGIYSFGASSWAIGTGGRLISLVDTAQTVYVPLDVPHGSTITAATVTYRGAGLLGNLPANKPSITIYKTNLTTGADTSIASASDNPASFAAYTAVHKFGITGLSEPVDRENFRYSAAVTSEFGANAGSGAVFFGVAATVSVSRLDESP